MYNFKFYYWIYTIFSIFLDFFSLNISLQKFWEAFNFLSVPVYNNDAPSNLESLFSGG